MGIGIVELALIAICLGVIVVGVVGTAVVFIMRDREKRGR